MILMDSPPRARKTSAKNQGKLQKNDMPCSPFDHCLPRQLLNPRLWTISFHPFIGPSLTTISPSKTLRFRIRSSFPSSRSTSSMLPHEHTLEWHMNTSPKSHEGP